MPEQTNGETNKKQNKYNLIIAVLVGQVGLLTMAIILAAVFGGLALDSLFGTRPWLTIGLLVISIPVSILLMIAISRKTVKKIRTSAMQKPDEEDVIGKDS